jgi:predicted RNase H-like HicB family nuclease
LEFRTEPDKLDGGWVAFCSDLPGCAGQGETEEEALRDAAAAAVAIIQLRVDRALQEYSEVESAKRLHKMSVAL